MVLVSYPVALVLLLVLATDRRRETSRTAAMFWGGLCGVSQAFGVWWFYAALGRGPDLGGVAVDGDPGRRHSRRRSAWRWGSGPASVAGVGVVLALVAVVLVSREATDEDVTPHKFTRRWPG